MKISLNFPLVSQIDSSDDLDAQTAVLLCALKFDPEDVAQQRRNIKKNLGLIYFVRLSNQEAYFYSPLFTGRHLTTDDEEVCFAYFDHKQEEYTQFPARFHSIKELSVHVKNKSLPTHMSWKGLEQHLTAQMNGPHTHTHFERWLSLQQNATLAAQVNDTFAQKSKNRKI